MATYEYELYRGNHYHNGAKLEPGDTVTMTEKEFNEANLKDRFRRVGSGKEDEDDSGSSDSHITRTSKKSESKSESTQDLSWISESSVAEVSKALESEDVTIDDLTAVAAYEADHGNRRGVISAVEKRMQQLQEKE